MKLAHTRPDQSNKVSFYSKKNQTRSVFLEGFANRYQENGIKLVDRGNDLIPPEAWGDLKNFQSNGIILFNHDRDNPVGRAVKVEKTDDGLFVKVKMSDSDHPEISRVRDLVKDGVLKTFSVGFDPKKMDEEDFEGKKVNVIKEAELLEISIVSLPMAERSLFNVTAKKLSEMPYDLAKKTCLGEVDSVEIVDSMTKEAQNIDKQTEDNEGGEGDEDSTDEAEESKEDPTEDDTAKEQEVLAAEEISSQPKEVPTSPLLDGIKQTNILLSTLISEIKLLSQKFDKPEIVLAVPEDEEEKPVEDEDEEEKTDPESEDEDEKNEDQEDEDEEEEKAKLAAELKEVDKLADKIDEVLRRFGY